MQLVLGATNQPKTTSDVKDLAETEETVKVLLFSLLLK